MYLTALCDHPYLVSLLFVVLLSLHLVTFLTFLLIVYALLFSSRHKPELRCAITQLQKSVPTSSIYGPLTRVLATLAVLAEEPLTQASIQTLSQPFSGWTTKSALPV